MAQLHLYLPEDLAEKVRQRAASRRQSVSDYLAELVRGQIADAWPEGYFENVVGGIREAFDAGELPWTKARKIVSVATSETEAEWLEKARALSNRDLEKEVRRHDGRGSGQFATLTISMPVEILDMWNDAYELAERLSGTELEKWQVLEPSLAEFLGTHLPADGAGARETDDEKELPDKVRDAVLDRDGWKCKFPGCTMRKMLDVHHIEFRSHLGSEDLDNKISLCRIHHELIHRGICRVTGAVGVDLKFERPQLVLKQAH